MARTSPSGVIRPSLFWFLLLDGGIVVLVKLVVSQRSYDTLNEMTGGKLPPRQALRALLAATAVIHATEALAAGGMAKRRGLSPSGWRLQTLFVGFPSLIALHKAGQD